MLTIECAYPPKRIEPDTNIVQHNSRTISTGSHNAILTLPLQLSASESQGEELRRQLGTLEGLLQEEQREVMVMQDSLAQETKLLKETRARLDQVGGFKDTGKN